MRFSEKRENHRDGGQLKLIKGEEGDQPLHEAILNVRKRELEQRLSWV